VDETLIKTIAENLLIHSQWEEFNAQFDKDALVTSVFPTAVFELTPFCTLKCPMCHIRLDKRDADILGGKLRSASEWIDMATQFRDQGGIFLRLTGGEPMLRPDFYEIYDHISRLGVFVTLFTNGTTIDDKMAELLRKRPPAMVGLTLYGASEETYRRFGGSAGSFRRAVDGLDRLLKIPGLKIEVKFTACSDNYKEAPGVYELAADRNLFVSLDCGDCAPVRGARSEARRLRLTEDQAGEFTGFMRHIEAPILEEYINLTRGAADVGMTDRVPDILPDDRHLRCKAGKTIVYIAWDGRMYPCDMASYPFAYPFEQGFTEAAFDIRRQIDTLLYPARCMTCANRDSFCSCIPKALNEMADCARSGERCPYAAGGDAPASVSAD
jgi:MoaA/NifB/PqqE/SkfB family radical SAM enzyme